MPYIQQAHEDVVLNLCSIPVRDITLENAKANVRINGKKFEEVKDGDDGTSSPRRGDLHAHTDLYSGRGVEPFDRALDPLRSRDVVSLQSTLAMGHRERRK